MFFQFACFLTQVFEVLFGNRQVLGKRGILYQSLYGLLLVSGRGKCRGITTSITKMMALLVV